MMKKTLYSISIIITALFLCGFVAGVEIGDPDDNQPSEPTSPVLEYEETIAPTKSNQELYKQYHLLLISSLEEALSSFQENHLWTYRMVHNSYKYVKLLKGLALDDYKSEYGAVLENLKPIISDLKKRNINKSKKMQLKSDLKKIKKKLEQDFAWGTVKEWIKQ